MPSRPVSLSMRTGTGFSYPHLDAFRRITGKQRCDSINESKYVRRMSSRPRFQCSVNVRTDYRIDNVRRMSSRLSFQCSVKSVKGAGVWIDPKISDFQMHYPRFKKEDYEKMDEMRLKLLLCEYGLKFEGSLDQFREYAIGTFLWPDQLSILV